MYNVEDLTGLPDIKDLISIREISQEGEAITIHGTLLQNADKAFSAIGERLKPLNLMPILRKTRKQLNEEACLIVELKILPIPLIPPQNKVWLNWVLLFATLITTIFAGTFLSGIDPYQVNLFKKPKLLIYGIPFSLSLLFVLGSHEFGHYFACRANGILATFPYFIPSPIPPLGTFGAVIRIKSPLQDKNRLIEVGASGPICGFIAAVLISIIGLKLSQIVPIAQQNGNLAIGNSLVFWVLSKLFTHLPQGYDVLLNPIAFAGWVGMFVTALNLLPIGQLDGGHITYAFLEERAKFIAWPVIVFLLSLGIFWQGWLVWAVLIVFLMRLKHPPPLNNVSPMSLQHKIIGILALIIFVLTFIPVPFKIYSVSV